MKSQLQKRYEDIISLDNLFAAWAEFLHGKKSKKDVREFGLNLSDNLVSLHQDLKNFTYKHGSYDAFKISDPKPRGIHKAKVRDRVLHHAIYRQMYSFFNRTFIADSYSCRLGKGAHRALNKFKTFGLKVSRNNTKTVWVLKCDIRKFFASMDHKILLDILSGYIPDKNTMWLMERIMASFDSGQTDIGLPLGNLTWKATAGQTITWNGYEYVQAPLKKNITSNLLLDFGGPGYMTGAGLEYLQGKWWVKTSVGNISNSHTPHGYDGQGAHWRVDYAKGEFQGWGASGLHGKVYQHGYNYLEADAYFIRGDVTLQGQIEGSQWQHAGFSGATTGTFGLSGLAAYKFTPQLEGIFRADYLDNHRGGGGTPATNTGNVNQLCPSGSATGELDKNGNPVTDINGDPAALCGDYRNGFGPGAVYDASAGVWALGDPNRGSKRSAFTVGLNYQYHLNGLLKTELRYDRSNLNSFYDWSSGGYKKDNLTFSVQTVVSWQ